MGVELALYVGEDWIQPLGFYADPVAEDPTQQTLTDPLALTHPEMMIRAGDTTALLASLDTTGLLDGTLVLGEPGQLTIQLPHGSTLALQGVGTARFDIFDDIGGVRRCILKAGTIVVTDAVTEWAG